MVNKLEKLDKRNCVEFDRESFRKSFNHFYEGIEERDYKTPYIGLFKFYKNMRKLIKIDPDPIPEKIPDSVIDKDLFNLEQAVAIVFDIGVNHVAQTLDKSAGRSFIPRDVKEGDGSYWGAYLRMKKINKPTTLNILNIYI